MTISANRNTVTCMIIVAAVTIGGACSKPAPVKNAKEPGPAKSATVNSKPLTKDVMPSVFVRKTVGRISVGVPKTWKCPQGVPPGMLAYCVGSDQNHPRAAFAAGWETKEDLRMMASVSGGTKKRATKLDGYAATEYLIGTEDGAVIVVDKAASDGQHLFVMIGSDTGEFKAYEPILRKMVKSVKIAPEKPARPAGK